MDEDENEGSPGVLGRVYLRCRVVIAVHIVVDILGNGGLKDLGEPGDERGGFFTDNGGTGDGEEDCVCRYIGGGN